MGTILPFTAETILRIPAGIGMYVFQNILFYLLTEPVLLDCDQYLVIYIFTTFPQPTQSQEHWAWVLVAQLCVFQSA
jgi:hypothetical protein